MQAIRRRLTRPGMFLALAGPWICQAEAAENLARALAELVDCGVIATTDSADCDGLRARSMKIDGGGASPHGTRGTN